MQFKQFFIRTFLVSFIVFGYSALAYMYQFFLNHGVSREIYGAFGQVMSLIIIGTLPATVIAMFVMRYVGLFHHRGQEVEKEHFIAIVLQRLIRYLILGMSILLILLMMIATVVHISYTMAILVTLIIGASILLVYVRTVLYSANQLVRYTISTIIEMAIRIGVTFFMLHWTQDLEIILLVYLVSLLIPLVYFIHEIRSWMSYRGGEDIEIDAREMRDQILPMACTAITLGLVGNLEILLSGRLLGTSVAADITAIMLIGKLILMGLGVANAIGGPYFPDGRRHKRFIMLLYVGMGIVSTVLILIFAISGDTILHMMLSPEYHDLTRYLGVFIPAMLIVAWLTVVLNHLSLAGYRQAGYMSLVIPASLIASLLLHRQDITTYIDGILIGYTIGGFLYLFLTAIWIMITKNSKKMGSLSEKRL